MKLLFAVLIIPAIAFAKDAVKVEVKAVHSASHEARDTRALIDKGILGSGAPNRTVDVFNLDTIIGGEHAVLECEDGNGCESPALGTYDGVLRHGHMKLAFELPVTHKKVSRWYKIAGSW